MLLYSGLLSVAWQSFIEWGWKVDLRIKYYLWNWVDPFIVAGEVVLSVNLVDIRLINILTRSSAISYDKMQNNHLYNKLDKEQCVLYNRIRFENNQFSNKLDKGQSSTGGVCNYATPYVRSLWQSGRRQRRPSQGRCRSLMISLMISDACIEIYVVVRLVHHVIYIVFSIHYICLLRSAQMYRLVQELLCSQNLLLWLTLLFV